MTQANPTSAPGPAAEPSQQDDQAKASTTTTTTTRGRYIVVLNKDADATAHRDLIRTDARFEEPKVRILPGEECGVYPGDTDVLGQPMYVAVVEGPSTRDELEGLEDVASLVLDAKLTLY